jgi:hypothetical protein
VKAKYLKKNIVQNTCPPFKRKKNLVMSFSISYPDLIKLVSFVVDLTQRGDERRPKRQDEDKATLRIENSIVLFGL